MKNILLATAVLAAPVLARMPATHADEPGRTQQPDDTLVEGNNISNTDTTAAPSGELEGTTGDGAHSGDEMVDESGQMTDEQFSDPAATRRPVEEETSSAKITKDVVPPHYRDKYAAGNGTCGDFIATEISAITKEGGVAALTNLRVENDIPEAKWRGLNNGMQRMNLANTLRARFLRGEPITIGGKQHSLAVFLNEFEGEGDEREPIDLTNADEVGKFIKMVDLQDTDRTRAAIIKALSPKPEKKPVKTAEERAAERKAKEDEREKERAARTAEREKAKAEKDAARAEEAKKREEEAAKKKAEREAEKAKRDEERAKAAAEKEAAKKQREEAKNASADAAAAQPEAAKTDPQTTATGVANKQASKGGKGGKGATK